MHLQVFLARDDRDCSLLELGGSCWWGFVFGRGPWVWFGVLAHCFGVRGEGVGRNTESVLGGEGEGERGG